MIVGVIVDVCVYQLAADAVINSLWMLMGAQMEELKLLQTAMLLITVNAKVQRESLARVSRRDNLCDCRITEPIRSVMLRQFALEIDTTTSKSCDSSTLSCIAGISVVFPTALHKGQCDHQHSCCCHLWAGA